jgi:gluconate 5-dehydrogenase
MKVQELFDLKGKVAVVTGGGRGVGQYIARGLAEAGADVVIGSRKLQNCEHVAEELKGLGTRALAVECDVAKVEDIDRFVNTAIQEFGRIDVLVNNSGINTMAPTLEYPLEKWEKTIAVNLRGPFLMCQKVAKQMVSQGGGKIINIASVAGLKGTPEETNPHIAYGASKGGLITMTKDLAVKLGRYNIQVNALALGLFRSDITARLELDEFKSLKEKLLSGIPLGRSAGEEDMKGVAVFLASGASDFITGAIIPVDGGLCAL